MARPIISSINLGESIAIGAHGFTRRTFLKSAALGAGCLALGPQLFADEKSTIPLPPLAVFSKVYQQLKLDFDQAAAVTAEAGYNGIDCPVRTGGEILPEHATEQMPKYAEALVKHGTKLMLLTTDITGLDSPYARDILVDRAIAWREFLPLGILAAEGRRWAGKADCRNQNQSDEAGWIEP